MSRRRDTPSPSSKRRDLYGIAMASSSRCRCRMDLAAANESKCLARNRRPEVAFDSFDQEMLLKHASLGCISVWCATSECAFPFVFRRRMVKGIIPCAQMIYCHDITDFVSFAGPIHTRTSLAHFSAVGCRNISRDRSAPASATLPIQNTHCGIPKITPANSLVAAWRVILGLGQP